MTTSAERPRLTACIVAFNEEDRIGACLESLSLCDEIIVVDSHSTDRTREISAEHGARVIERDWSGFGDQKNFCVEEASSDWILALDADERISPELHAELVALLADGVETRCGWNMPRMTNYLGGWIRHGVWYPNRQLRLFDRRKGSWQGAEPHPKVVVDGAVGALKHPIQHYAFRDFEEHLEGIRKYTKIMAGGMHERGRSTSPFKLVSNSVFAFFSCYVLKRGFLDGWRGMVVAVTHAHYVGLKHIRLLIKRRTSDTE